jgi:uncharacterized protein YjbK
MASSYGRQILQCGSNPKIAIPTIKDDNLNAFAIFLFFGLQVEEDIDVAKGRACVSDPSQLVDIDCKLIQAVVSDYSCRQFVCLGGFRNVRNVYSWEALKLELDETQYAFGTTYEIECETTEPERFREQLGSLLDSNRIPYSYSTMSKFGIFRSGKVPPFGGLTTA